MFTILSELYLQLFCFWTLTIVLFLFIHTVFRRLDSGCIFMWNLLSWAQSIQLVSEMGNVWNRNRMMDNVQKHIHCITIPSSQTFGSYLQLSWYSNGITGWTVVVRFWTGARDFSLLHSILSLGPTHPPVQWVPGALSWSIRQPWCETHHSPPSSAEFKNCGTLPSLLPLEMSTWRLSGVHSI
jgi:hypothetical protein